MHNPLGDTQPSSFYCGEVRVRDPRHAKTVFFYPALKRSVERVSECSGSDPFMIQKTLYTLILADPAANLRQPEASWF